MRDIGAWITVPRQGRSRTGRHGACICHEEQSPAFDVIYMHAYGNERYDVRMRDLHVRMP